MQINLSVPRYEEYRDTYVPALPLSDHPRDVDVRRHHSAMEATGSLVANDWLYR